MIIDTLAVRKSEVFGYSVKTRKHVRHGRLNDDASISNRKVVNFR